MHTPQIYGWKVPPAFAGASSDDLFFTGRSYGAFLKGNGYCYKQAAPTGLLVENSSKLSQWKSHPVGRQQHDVFRFEGTERDAKLPGLTEVRFTEIAVAVVAEPDFGGVALEAELEMKGMRLTAPAVLDCHVQPVGVEPGCAGGGRIFGDYRVWIAEVGFRRQIVRDLAAERDEQADERGSFKQLTVHGMSIRFVST